MAIEELINMTFVKVSSRSTSNETDESISTLQIPEVDDQSEANNETKANQDEQFNRDSEANPSSEDDATDLPKEWRFHQDHPQENLLTQPSKKEITKSGLQKMIGNMAFVSQIELKKFKDAHDDENWIMAMQEELNQFERSKVQKLVPRPKKKISYWHQMSVLEEA